MIMQIGTVPIYSGQVTNFKKHLDLLKPYIGDDSYWHQTSDWISKTISTIDHDKNYELPWNIILNDLEPHINDYLSIFKPVKPFTFESRPWLNKYEKGEWQEQHNHIGATSHFSLAYILDSQGQENFVFQDSPGNWFDPLRELHLIFENWPKRSFIPKQQDGTILIFPASTDHFVTPNQSSGRRITASANIHITGNNNDRN